MLLESDQVFLGNNARYVLLMRGLALSLASLLLVGSALFLGLDSSLGCLEALSFDQLGVPHLLVLLFLVFHDCKLGFFEDFHARLLKGLQAEHIEHGFDLGVEIKQLCVVVKDLGLLAVLFGWHLRLEKRHRRSVKVELSGDADLLGRWLVRQILDVFVRLKANVGATGHRLRRRDVPVRVDGHDALRGL